MSSQAATSTSLNTLVLFVNGKKVEVRNPDPELTLLDFLRKKPVRLTGSKMGCGEGGCGSCTVMASRYDPVDDAIDHYPVNACLAPLCNLHGLAITTVEGIGSVRGKLHPVQRQIAESHGSQCGFCTPGFVMSMYTLLRNNPRPKQPQVQETLDGNLCRCTGYRPILEGFNAFAKNSCPMGSSCCQNGSSRETISCCQNGDCGKNPSCCQKTGQNGDTNLEDREDCYEINGHEKAQLLYDPAQEPIFPPELKLHSVQLQKENLRFESDRVTWLSPSSLTELLAIRKHYPECKLVCGNTEVGIEVKFKKMVYPVLVSVSRVADLMNVKHTEQGIQIGASLPLNKVDAVLKSAIKKLPEYQTRVFAAITEMLKWFAGHQVRSVACLAGNIMTASPISDMCPLLLACKAVLEVMDTEGARRQVLMDESFFTGYRKTCLNKTDTLLSVTVPYTRTNEHFFGYKQANRKEDDIAIVNAGMRVDLGDSGTHVKDISLAFGGMSTTVVLATRTSRALIGKKWDETLLETVCFQDMLQADLPLLPGSPGGMVAYRRTLTLSFFFRFYAAVSQKLDHESTDLSAINDIPLGIIRGSQVFEMPSDLQSTQDLVGRPIVHTSALTQATGEAVYVDDVPASDGELFAGFVMSTKAHARILSVDPSVALRLPGVVDFVTAKDVPGSNNWNDFQDLVFASEEVLHEGQVVGMILAESLATARRAASLVEVEYQEMEPIITIQDAIKKNSYFDYDHEIQRGDVDQGLAEAEHVMEGEFHVEAQEHFYLEPNACIVYPRDADEYHVICMTHYVDVLHMGLSKVLDVQESHINIAVKRIGGSFGGKQARHSSVVCPAAVGAYKTQRPVRAVLDRDEDMRLTGTRHPLLAKYKAGFNKQGQLLALKLTVYYNCGMSMDVSPGIADKCTLAIGHAYKIPNIHITSKLCKTNIPSCTAFRGYGVPEGVSIVENVVQYVADVLGLPSEQVRERNFYQQGDTTAYGQIIHKSSLLSCWQECLRMSEYHQRFQLVQEYNRCNKWKKRGISVVPLTYSIGYPKQSMNQGMVIVNVYKDGSVLIHSGGVEMGQGLNTKMVQVVTRALDIPQNYIRVAEATTNCVPNTPPTAGSMGSDLFCMAALKACEKLTRRLAPYRAQHPDQEWKELVANAIQDRECVSAIGYYKVDTPGMDWSKSVNSPFPYYSFGAACSEVEIDCLTGDHQVLRTDIVMDVGNSLNPAIDVGQIEGAFVQGYGMLVLEQYKVTGQGRLLTTGPGSYKIPSVSNIPQVFNVTLLKDSSNPKAVYSSKAIGEPPQCLATSVFLAIQSAISARRADNGHTGYFQADSPLTPDQIRMACVDQFSQQFLADDDQDKQRPWFVKL